MLWLDQHGTEPTEAQPLRGMHLLSPKRRSRSHISFRCGRSSILTRPVHFPFPPSAALQAIPTTYLGVFSIQLVYKDHPTIFPVSRAGAVPRKHAGPGDARYGQSGAALRPPGICSPGARHAAIPCQRPRTRRGGLQEILERRTQK